jgi:hypothetical protein
MQSGDEHSANSVRLNVAGHEVVVEPDESQIRGPLATIFRTFRGILDGLPVHRRAVIGLAGIPGSGKSTLAALLAYLSTRIDVGRALAAVSMDGWHWPNVVLETMPALDADGRPVTMRRRKGSPGSFDVEGILRAMAMLRDAHLPVRLPAYDRRRHDPVPDAVIVPPGVRLVLIEGNYVLVRDEPWRRVAEQLDLAVYLEVERDAARDAVIARHVAGGMSRTEAVAQYDANDRLNTEVVLASRRNADLLVHADADHRLVRVESLTERAVRAEKRLGLPPGVGHRHP